MKGLFACFLVAIACLCLVQSADAWNRPQKSDRFNCFNKNRDVGNAIETFCFKNNNMVSDLIDEVVINSVAKSQQVVPSQKARDGAWSKKGKISVWIRGE